MPQATQAALDAHIALDDEALAGSRPLAVPGIRVTVHDDLGAIERDWREFEQQADGTAFQSFDWLSTWQRHVGSLTGVEPAIGAGRDPRGALLFLLPLGVERRGLARRLAWLGSDLCDYNGPLLAPDFSRRIGPAEFVRLWRDTLARLRRDPRRRFDVVDLDKMQATVGAQANPFMALGVRAHADNAYATALGGDWETFYTDKRSSATRRRDRTKRKRMAELGEVRFVGPTGLDDRAATLAALIEQKSEAFAAMGVGNMFERPGHHAFYDALATDPALHAMVHVSRFDIGGQTAAANLGLVFGGRYYHLLASHQGGELSKFGPGAAHLHELMRAAIERGCRAFDFTIGDERYKREWCDAPITLYDHVAPATLRGCLAATLIVVVGRAKRLIKQTPALWQAASRLRAATGPLRRRLRG
jgi:CelD/BcsL family acetyltransferase involved in cellulose biosynthesis